MLTWAMQSGSYLIKFLDEIGTPEMDHRHPQKKHEADHRSLGEYATTQNSLVQSLIPWAKHQRLVGPRQSPGQKMMVVIN